MSLLNIYAQKLLCQQTDHKCHAGNADTDARHLKEAAFKAISSKLDDKYSVCWKDFEVVNDEQGRPQMNLLNINTDEIESIDVSISHCKLYATANVVILYKD